MINDTITVMIQKLAEASDKYGSPYLNGFMDDNNIIALCDCYAEPERYAPMLEEYIAERLGGSR